MKYTYEISVILIVMAATFLTRFFPFALFGHHQEPPKLIQYLGKILPSAVIAILIVYCLKSTNFTVVSSFIPQGISVLIVIGLHLWKRNNLISIGLGTIGYMFLIHFVFI